MFNDISGLLLAVGYGGPAQLALEHGPQTACERPSLNRRTAKGGYTPETVHIKSLDNSLETALPYMILNQLLVPDNSI
jgi:hypothetical protein